MAGQKRRRQRGEGSVFQRNDGQWAATLDLGYRNGRRRRKTIYGRTQREAVRKLNAAKNDLAKHGDIPTASMTVEQWMTKWLTEIAPQTGTPNKMRGYREKTRNYIFPAIGRVRLDRLAPQHVRDLHNYVIREKGLSPSTAYGAHRTLSVALNDAMREGVASRNVAAIVKAPQPGPGGRGAFSLVEARVIGHVIAGARLEARWLLALLYGARKGECLGLRWDYVDLSADVLDLAWQLQRIPYRHGCGAQGRHGGWPCGHRFGHHCPRAELDVREGFEYEQLEGNLCLYRPKTAGSTRLLPIIEPMSVALRRRREQYLRERQVPGYVDHGLVWSHVDGRPMDAWQDGDMWNEVVEAAGVTHRDLHSARHSAATLLQALGVDESTRMMILGHSSAATQRRYAHRDLTLQRQALEALARHLLSIEA